MHNKKGSQIYIAVLNFSKAFDTVPHDGLFSKLKHYGIDEKILLWIYNILTRQLKCGGSESHQTLGTIMIKAHWYCYLSYIWQLVQGKVQNPSPSSRTRVARVASRRGNVVHSFRVD